MVTYSSTTLANIRDGTDATGLKDSIPFYLASDKETDITIYDEGWSTLRPALDATNKYLWVYYLSRYSDGTTDPELIEVSGDIATFENNGDVSPIYSTEIDIEPIQDLNGFDHAWNGGDGKNLLVYPYSNEDTYTSHDVTFTVEKYSNGAVKDILINGTASASTFFNFSGWANSSSAKTDMSKYCGQSMILSGGTSNARIVIQYRKPNSTSNIYMANDTGSGITFTVPDASDLGTWAIFISITSGTVLSNVRVYPMLRLATETDATYEPYENICPINGRDSIKIERTGKNLLVIKYPNRTNNGVTFTVNGSTITANGTATSDAWSSANLSGITNNLQYKNLIPPGQYMLTGGKSNDKRIYLTGNYLNGKGITVVNDYGNGALYTFTDWAYVYPQVQITSGTTVENEVFNIQFEATTTATEYESYCGNTYEIDFPTEAETIFKGKLVIDENGNGQLIQTHELKTLIGNDIAGIAITKNVTRFYTKASYTNCEIVSCDSYKINDNATTTLNRIGKMAGDARIFGTQTWLQGITTKEEAQVLLNANPINIVIELAEPIIYHLTAKQILAILKTNHIYANTGNITVKYYDNQKVTEPYIDYSATSAFEYSAEALDKIDNLEIGGRNLIIGTLNPDARDSDMHRPHLPGQITNTSGRGTCTVAEHGLRFTLTEANWCYIYFGASANSAKPCMLGLEAGQTYTLSADLSWKILSSDTGKANTTTYGMGGILSYSTEANPNSFTTAVSNYPLPITQADKGTDMSGRLVFTFTVPEDAVRLYLGIRANNTTANHYAIGDYIEARNMKLEKGSKATDWTPAPEDMQANIDTALAQSIWYATCADAGAIKSATISPVTNNFTLNIGVTVNVKFDNTNTGAVGELTLNVNGTGAKSIKYIYNNNISNIPAKDYIRGGRTYLFVYDGEYWVIQNLIYNTNNYDRRQHSNAITAKTAITEKHLIVGDSTGYQQITSTSGGSLEFDLGYPILWAYSDIAATKTSTATYEAYPSVNFSTSGTIQDGATNKMLWLKGTIRGNIFTLASTNFLTTRIPTSDDGMYYIPLGIMSSATAGYFSSSNRIYAYIDEEFQPLDNAAALKASSAYETAVQARSEIVQTQQTLSLQIRDISVGGANLFERTKTFEGTANQSTAHDSFTEFVYKDLTVKNANTVTFGNQVVELSAYQYTDLTPNMWYSFSFYAKGNVDIGFMYAGTGNAVIDSIDVSWDNNTHTGFNTTSTSSNIIWLTPTNNWQRYSVVFHIEEQDITALHRLIGLYARPVSSYTEFTTESKDILITETGTDVHLIMEGNEVQICGYKLELGNKPTDWTPADNDKATYDNIISQINLSKEGIAIRADKIRLEGMITANEGFSIDEYGNMTANNGTFNGLFESYATEINENTFDLSINNGHIQFYNNDRTLTEDERYVGYIGGIRKNTSFIDGSIKNNDAITIGLYNNSDFLIDAYDDTTSTPVCEVLNYVTGKPTFNFWVPARIYDGNKLQMYSRNESHGSQIEFRRYSKNTGGYVSRGSLSLHSIQDNSDISDRIYLLSKNQGNDLAGDQFLYFAGKGLRYSSSGQPMRTGYVATDKYIVTQYFSLPDLTITKNTSQNFTIDVSRDGYTPIMCIPKVGGGQNAFYLSIYTWSMSGNIVTIRTHNNSSTSDVSNVTISLQVLYKLTY